MRSRLVVLVIVLSTTASVRAEDYAGVEPTNIDLDAQFGLEGLDEPTEVDPDVLETNPYANVNLAGLLQFYNLQAFLQGPLRFNMSDDFSIREEDWDESREAFRVMRCVRMDYFERAGSATRRDESGTCQSWTPDESAGAATVDREEFIYLSTRLNPLSGYTLGYGGLVGGFDATLEEDEFLEGLTAELNVNRLLVFSGGLSNLQDPEFAAGRLAFRPVQQTSTGTAYSDGYSTYVDSSSGTGEFFVELGVTAASDLKAPTGFDPVTGQFETREDGLTAGAVDGRLRYSVETTSSLDNWNILRFEVGSELNELFDFGKGLMNHLRFYYDIGTLDFFLDGEHRLLMGQYLPSYFDQHYQIQRRQFLLSDDQRRDSAEGSNALTKLDYLATLPDEDQQAYAGTASFRFWSKDLESGVFNQEGAFWTFIEQIPDLEFSGRAGVGLSLFNIDNQLSASGQFVQQGWDDFSGIFDANNAVLDVSAIYMLSEEMYLDFYYNQAWFLLEGTDQFETANDVGVNLGFTQDLQ